MLRDKKVIVVMPAYNAEKTLLQTHREVLEQRIVDLVIIVDNASSDQTTLIAKSLPQTVVCTHAVNSGYGANQKTCHQPLRSILREAANTALAASGSP